MLSMLFSGCLRRGPVRGGRLRPRRALQVHRRGPEVSPVVSAEGGARSGVELSGIIRL